MSVKTAYRAFFLPEWRGSVLKKRAAAWFTMRSWGLGIFPNKRPDGSNWPKGPCLPQSSQRQFVLIICVDLDQRCIWLAAPKPLDGSLNTHLFQTFLFCYPFFLVCK